MDLEPLRRSMNKLPELNFTGTDREVIHMWISPLTPLVCYYCVDKFQDGTFLVIGGDEEEDED